VKALDLHYTGSFLEKRGVLPQVIGGQISIMTPDFIL